MLSVHSTFALIAPVFLFLLGVAQLGVWGFWRRQAPLLGQGVAFVAASMGMLVQILGWKEPFWSRVLAFSSCYVLAAAAMAVALALRLQVRTRWPWLLCLGVLLLAVQLWFALIHPSLLVRVYALSLGCMALLAVPLLQWPQMRLRNRFDNALCWVCVAMVVVNVVRTLLQLPLDPGHVYVYAVGEFIETFFWFLLYVLLMVACACAAGCLLAAVVHDELVLLASERSQDPLTQLRNRRGFAECTTRLFRQLQRRRPSGPQTCALLLCDIDHFKQINDRWGHAVGDEVLVHIAQVLQAHGSGDDVLARVGGEEAAIADACAGARSGAALVRCGGGHATGATGGAADYCQHWGGHAGVPQRTGPAGGDAERRQVPVCGQAWRAQPGGGRWAVAPRYAAICHACRAQGVPERLRRAGVCVAGSRQCRKPQAWVGGRQKTATWVAVNAAGRC